MSADALTHQLIDLLRAAQFERLLSVWQSAPSGQREIESAKRTAAAALAQIGNLASSYQLLSELAVRREAEPASLLLAGRVAFDLGEFGASVDHFERLVHRDRGNVDAWRRLADAALRARQPDRALRGAEVHTLLFVHDVDLAIRHASLLALAGRIDEALIAFERLLARWPNHAIAGPAFAEFVMRELPLESADLLDRTPWMPTDGVLSGALVRALLWLPAWYASSESARRWRERLLANLRLLTTLAERSPLTGDERAHCLATTPFFAAYHDADVTEIQFAWGDFVEALVAPLRAGYLPERKHSSAIRTIGIVSNRLTDSSAGRFFNPWLATLRDAGYTVRLYAIGSFDHVTDELSSLFPTHRFPSDDVAAWRPLANQLHTDANDVLIYPEPQGSQLIQLIAGIRFAPVQCAAFGNPLTTGLRSMDYFFVPDGAEVNDSSAHYREHVVRLAGLGVSMPTVPVPSSHERSAFGLGAGDHVVLVSQQLQKWTPDFVDALLQIMLRDSAIVLVYFAVASGVSVRAFENYLRQCFCRAGLSFASRTRALGMLARADYLSLHGCADVALDTFGFSGGSSTLDALAMNLPVVSLEGRYLRSRQSAAMLRAGGQIENVVASFDDYVAHALRTVAQRETVITRTITVPETSLRPAVYRDVADFFLSLP